MFCTRLGYNTEAAREKIKTTLVFIYSGSQYHLNISYKAIG
jgi:hypothetical protein